MEQVQIHAYTFSHLMSLIIIYIVLQFLKILN